MGLFSWLDRLFGDEGGMDRRRVDDPPVGSPAMGQRALHAPGWSDDGGSAPGWGGDGPALSCEVNPATGLLMVGGVGGVDVAGNPYGADLSHEPWAGFGDPAGGPWIDDGAVNPASGLPMVGGVGGVDVAGNPYGFDDSHGTAHHGSGFGDDDGGGFRSW
jgi:hypothetical protein